MGKALIHDRDITEDSFDLTTIQGRLRYAIWCADMTQREVAQQSGVIDQTITNWITGRSEPIFFKIARVARVIGADLNWLAHGDAVDEAVAAGG